MPSFAAGVVRFQRDVFPKKKALFEKLRYGQKPEALFIACSDSRVETGMITQTDPGEIFVCRNAGNIVPPHKREAGGITASIEYAVDVLGVQHIIVCGHTDCGAMNGALHPETVADLHHVREWLSYSAEAVARAMAKNPGEREADRLMAVTQENVVLQLENLAGHPAVARRVREDAIKLHGWVYDIASGAVLIHDEETQRFVPIAEKYAARFARDGVDGP